jgi:hypothetical protein
MITGNTPLVTICLSDRNCHCHMVLAISEGGVTVNNIYKRSKNVDSFILTEHLYVELYIECHSFINSSRITVIDCVQDDIIEIYITTHCCRIQDV